MNKDCSHLVEVDVPRRPANALNVEVGTPLPRCKLKAPEEWRGREPRSGFSLVIRWLGSGGSPFVLGACTPNCPDCPVAPGGPSKPENWRNTPG